MPPATQSSRTLRKILLAAVLLAIIVSIVLAVSHRGPWQIPQDEKLRKNPLSPTTANLDSAKSAFKEYCSNCHGDYGEGDGSDAMMYDPAPSDLTNPKIINKLTDGDIYYQITVGRKPMPSFRAKLSDDQRWQLVLLVRQFAANPPHSQTTPEKSADPAPTPPAKH
jgi:mono/diheme cytochrome c family protein